MANTALQGARRKRRAPELERCAAVRKRKVPAQDNRDRIGVE